MYAGVGSFGNSANPASAVDNEISDIPEWKKKLMKRRTGSGVEEHARAVPDSTPGAGNVTRNGIGSKPESSVIGKHVRPLKSADQDAAPTKTVTRTIGNISVELRSVKPAPDPHQDAFSAEVLPTSDVCYALPESEDEECEDLQYGPGIVDRLRNRFLNMCVRKQYKPVVRKFSSLENLPGSHAGHYRLNSRRQNGIKASVPVKKAQSMETLLSGTSDHHPFVSTKKPCARYVGGVKARILSKNLSPISVFANENEEPKEKSPSPTVSPKPSSKSLKKWDYNRSVSAPNINEDELPKPDTVKHVKQMFEAPPVAEKTLAPVGNRFRKSSLTLPPTSSAIVEKENAQPGGIVKKQQEKWESAHSRPVAAVYPSANRDPKTVATPEEVESELVLSPNGETDQCNDEDPKINKPGYSPLSFDELSASAVTPIAYLAETLDLPSEQVLERSESSNRSLESDEDGEDGGNSVLTESPCKVTTERLPLEESNKHTEALFQGSRVGEQFDACRPEHKEGGAESLGFDREADMVVAASSGGEASAAATTQKETKKAWQKDPQSNTSVVFDFRGKDVKPNISLNPTPFGCRPAKVSKNSLKKRAGSPPRAGVNDFTKLNGIAKGYDDDEDDDEDWDEMDIGADLPAVSGIVFAGENVKVGRGALLETRNKKLTIQFDDQAISTFEYPSENTSPSPEIENGEWTEQNSPFDTLKAMGSVANSRLSNYTPQVLSSNKDFELGVSLPNNRFNSNPPLKSEDDVPNTEEIVPANPDETGGWSSSETSDILF